MRRDALAYACATSAVFLLFHTDNLIVKAAALAALLAFGVAVALANRALRPLLLADALVTGGISALLIVSPATFAAYRWGWLAHGLAVCVLVVFSADDFPLPRQKRYWALVGFSLITLPGALLALPLHYSPVDAGLVLWTLGGLPLLGAGLTGGGIRLRVRLPLQAFLLILTLAASSICVRSLQAFPNFSATDEAMIYNYVDTFERTGKIEASLVPYPAPTVTGNLYVYTATLWTRAFPDDPFALRGLSMLAGFTLVGVTFLAGRALADTLTGGIAAALLATNLLWLAVAHVGRQEMALALCVWLAVWLALAAQKRGSAKLALVAGLVVALSADVHPLGALACVALGGWWLANSGAWRHYASAERLVLIAFVLGGLVGTAYYVTAHVLPDPAYFVTGVRDELVSYGAEGSTPPGAMLARHLNYALSNPLEVSVLLACAFVGLRRREGRQIGLFAGALVLLYALLVADPNPYYPIIWMPGVVICAALGLRRVEWHWRAPLLVALLASFAFNAALIERHVRADWNGRALDAIERVSARVSGRAVGETFLYLALRDPEFTGFTFVAYEAANTGVSRWQVIERLKPDWIVTMTDESAFRPEFDILSVDVPHMRLDLPDAALAGSYHLSDTISTSVGVFQIWRHS